MIIELHEREIALIIALRKRFRHGEVVVMMRDGVPQYIKKAWPSEDLSKPDLTELEGSLTVKLE
jgi:hypothetical protein